MELALQWKISPEMKKKNKPHDKNERPWLTPIMLQPPPTQHARISLPGGQNTKSKKKLKEKHHFFLAPPPTNSIHM